MGIKIQKHKHIPSLPPSMIASIFSLSASILLRLTTLDPSLLRSGTQFNESIHTRHKNTIQSKQRQIKQIATSAFNPQKTPPRIKQLQALLGIGKCGRSDEQQQHKTRRNREVGAGI